MAIGFKKFRVGAGETTDSVIDYLADPQARGDYYTEGGQAVLRWLATARLQRLFALGGPIVVGRTAMRMLLEGRHPVTGEMIRRWGPNGTAIGAIDVTISPAPKSVSVLWALADRETRHEIERMVWLSADLAIAALTRKPLVRQRFGRGKNDIRHEAMPDIIGVQTLHTTARLSERGDGVPDPQLHVHSLLIGALDAAGRLRAMDSRQMMIHQNEIDARASARLAEMFRRRGFPIVRTTDDRGRVSWELDEIPAAVLRLASSRREEIIAEGPGSLREQYREWCREQFGAERDPIGQAWEDFLSAHRGPKATLHGRELREAWAEQYETAGWGALMAQEYIARATRQAATGIVASDDAADAIDQFRQEFLDDLCREHALVPESHVDAMTFEKAKGLIDVTTALAVVGAMFSEGDLLVAPDGRVTTLAIVAEEQRARSAAQQLMDLPARDAPRPEAVQQAIEESARLGLPLDEHQEAAVRLATSGSRFVSITGRAGTGKGVTSGIISPLWRAEGREVIALAVAGRTAQQAGHDARADLAKTIDGLVFAVEHGYRSIDAGTVLVVDEAAMIDHARYASLLEVAARAEATVIQAGDDRQLSPVGPGGLWTLIHASAAERGLTAELRVVRRAEEAAEAQAWNDVREGRLLEALHHWEERGRLRLYNSRSELHAGMVDEWWTDAAGNVMLVDTSNAERDVINRLAQQRRAAAGELGEEVLALENGCQVRAGDHVVFREIKDLEPMSGTYRVPRIENGTTATVTAVDPVRGHIKLVLHEPHGERIATVGRDTVLNLAYARHVQLGQGMTAAGAGQVGVSGHTDREDFYVMVSRARAGAVIHAERGAVAALAAPGLGSVTDAQAASLERLGVDDIPDDWTWADASIEIDARRGQPLGGWAMNHLTDTMRIESLLAAHLVAQAIARRQVETGEVLELDALAASVRMAASASIDSAAGWQTFLAALEEQREALAVRTALALQLSRQGAKEAVGDRPVSTDPVRDQARHAEREAELVALDSRLADIDYALDRAWRAQREHLAELPLPQREPDLATIRLSDGVEVSRGQVIRFGHPDWLAGAARIEVQPDDLGVVLGCHRGGVTWDYATVELVGGRQIEVWETAQGIKVEPDLAPSDVRRAIPRPDQRDPTALNVFELVNGARLKVGDRVRFTDATAGAAAGSEGVVDDIERHRLNRAFVQLDDGRLVTVHPHAELAIVTPVEVSVPPELTAGLSVGVANDGDRWARPLPAASPLELVARWETMDNLPRALALYEALGQLHVSPDPVREVVRLWRAEPESGIVVQTWEQASAVREAIRQEPHAADGGDPLVFLAVAAYRSRVEAAQAGESGHVIDTAYVLADLADRPALTTALSVAERSHLVTRPPDQLTADLQAIHAREIAAALETADSESSPEDPTRFDSVPVRTLEVAIEASLREADAQRQTEQQAERQAGDD